LRGFLISLFLMLRSLLRPIAFGVAGAIFDSDGRVLLARQTYAAGWRLPGGAIGLGEGPETALRRELHEELGLTGGRVRLFGIYSRKLWWLTHVVALYVIEGGEINFHPNLEVSAFAGTRRRCRHPAPRLPPRAAWPSLRPARSRMTDGEPCLCALSRLERFQEKCERFSVRNRDNEDDRKRCRKTARIGKSAPNAPKTRRGSPR
jgi:8-oxo-dGTP pyrophosphatase MutT (NUDIX family)